MHFLRQKRDWGAKGAPRVATLEIKSPILSPFGSNFECMSVFCADEIVLDARPFFPSILGRIERSRGWANMQSVHACAVQTHFLVFACFLYKRFPNRANRVDVEVIFCSEIVI